MPANECGLRKGWRLCESSGPGKLTLERWFVNNPGWAGGSNGKRPHEPSGIAGRGARSAARCVRTAWGVCSSVPTHSGHPVCRGATSAPGATGSGNADSRVRFQWRPCGKTPRHHTGCWKCGNAGPSFTRRLARCRVPHHVRRSEASEQSGIGGHGHGPASLPARCRSHWPSLERIAYWLQSTKQGESCHSDEGGILRSCLVRM